MAYGGYYITYRVSRIFWLALPRNYAAAPEWSGKFGEEVYIIWGVLYDESLSVGDIKMTVIDTE